MQNTNSLTGERISELLGASLEGPADIVVTGANFIQRATSNELAFVGDKKQLKRIETSAARIIIVPTGLKDSLAEYSDRTFIAVDDPETAFLQIAELLHPSRTTSTGRISAKAEIAESASIGKGTTVHPYAVIGEEAVIGDHCEIGPGCSIGPGATIGSGTKLDANVVIYPDTEVGNNVEIQAGTALGATGFGYKTVEGRHIRLPHVGKVVIEDDVQIGVNSSIDRAKVGITNVSTGTRIDNSVVIAHNCQIGPHNLLVSQTGIAGSSSTGAYVVCAGQAGIADHVHLGDGAIIGAQAGVHRDMPGGESYMGAPAAPAKEQAKVLMALRRLPEIRGVVKDLQKQIASLQQQLAELQGDHETKAAA